MEAAHQPKYLRFENVNNGTEFTQFSMKVQKLKDDQLKERSKFDLKVTNAQGFQIYLYRLSCENNDDFEIVNMT